MTNLEKRLCLAHAAWERWNVERKLLEEELGCKIEDLGFQQLDVYGSDVLDVVFVASPNEIIDRVREREKRKAITVCSDLP